MLSFRPVTLSMREEIRGITEKEHFYVCENSFANMLLWQPVSKTRVCIQNGVLYTVTTALLGPKSPEGYPDLEGEDGEALLYHYPLGCPDDESLAEACRLMEEHAASRSAPFILGDLTESQRGRIETLFPDRFFFVEDRDNADYVYETEALTTLSGKKLHAKRNHLNKFQSLFGGATEVVPLRAGSLAELEAFQDEWYGAEEPDAMLDDERAMIGRAFRNFDELGLVGVILKVRGEIAAYTFGSRINSEVFDVHVEKALARYAEFGAYSVVNNEFVKRCLQSYRYVNREEDMGIEGLRKAKLSYQPAMILLRSRAFPRETVAAGEKGARRAAEGNETE